MDFNLECFQNEYLASGAGDVNAIITVTASGAAPPPAGEGAGAGAVVLLIDVSGSMEGQKIRQARMATMAALGCLRDGVQFAVLAGNHTVRPVYPQRGLAVATTTSRQAAAAEVNDLRSGGGTSIGRWLRAAAELLKSERGVRQTILLTDGRNEGETQEDLEEALAQASKVFQCHCRGVGTDWSVPELTHIAEALMGSVDIVADPAHLTADFEQTMRDAMTKAVSDLSLRVWVPQGATLEFVKQVAPTLRELAPIDTGSPLTTDFPLGAWGTESRDYHLAVRVKPGGTGDEMLAARITVMVDGQPAGQTLVRATWTEDPVLSTRINRQVAHYTGQQELADAIRAGLEARDRGDDHTARVKLGRAVQLAAASGNTEASENLAKVVDVEDADTGTVKLKKQVTEAAVMTLDTRSTRTSRFKR